MATPSSPALKHHPCRYPAVHNLPAAKVSAVKMKGERAYRSSRVPGERQWDATPLPRLHRHTSRSSHVTPPRRWCAAEPPPPAASTHPQTRPAVERQIPQPAKPALFPARGSALGATGFDNAKAIKLVQNESARWKLAAGYLDRAGSRACGDGRSAVGSSTREIWVSRQRLGSACA